MWPPYGPDDFFGQIILMPTEVAGFSQDDGVVVLPCNGEILAIEYDGPLFALIGNTYGGDGQITFALPKLTPPPGLEHHTYFIVMEGLFPG